MSNNRRTSRPPVPNTIQKNSSLNKKDRTAVSSIISQWDNNSEATGKKQDVNISRNTFNKLSDYRRAQIKDAIIKNENLNEDNDRLEPILSHSSPFRGLLKKQAASLSTVVPTSKNLTDLMGPEVYSPLFQLANMNLPRDRVTMNAWNRIFYDTHPIVRNAINLHASFPISKINISHPSKQVEQFFLEMTERIDLYSAVYGAALEFWKIGECFPYAELDKNSGTWKTVKIMNPDYIHVKKSPIGNYSIISLRPDAGLQRLVSSKNPSDLELKRRLPKHIIDAVRKGQTIPLSDINISHLKLLSSPYDIRGTSIIVSVYKDVIHYDKIREAKFAQADGMINPLTLVKIGGGSENYRATQSDLEAHRIALEEAQYDKDFKLITHDGVSIERIGYSGAVLDVAADIELINDNIYAGLMVPKALIQQESTTYASSSIGLEVLRQRYDIFRNMIKKWLEQKIFAPIAELQDFFNYENGEKILQVPRVDFNHMNLYDMSDYVQSIGTFVSNKQVSLHTVYRSLGLSYEEEMNRLDEEAIELAKKAKREQILSGMRLTELEALRPGSKLVEPTETTLADGGLGDLGGGEEPSLPGLEQALPGLGGPSPGGPGATPAQPEGLTTGAPPAATPPKPGGE